MSTAPRTTRSTVPRALLYTSVESPIGELLLLGDGQVLSGLSMQAGRKPIAIRPRWRRSCSAFEHVHTQLQEYFAGERAAFDVSLMMQGDPFERLVWRA